LPTNTIRYSYVINLNPSRQKSQLRQKFILPILDKKYPDKIRVI